MAVLPHTRTRLHRDGLTVIDVYRATVGGAAADEWIATGLSNIIAILGAIKLGSSPEPVNVVPNADGTGVTEGDDPGSIGVEAATGSEEVLVTVIGTI